MDHSDWRGDLFEAERGRLRAVAYQMLGSLSDADDAVQDTWVKLSAADGDAVDNLAGWLTTVVARVCLNKLRSRNVRREEQLGAWVPDPVVSLEGQTQPENEALLADSVGLALLIVLDRLSPPERLAFVLHDMFRLPFEEIASMIDRTPEGARQLASRARRRVKGADLPRPDADVSRQRRVVDAFFAAARNGDIEALVAVLHPDVIMRSDVGADRRAPSKVTRGAAAVADQAFMFRRLDAALHPVVVNGTAGVVISVDDEPITLMAFTVSHGKIVEIDAIADPARVSGVVADMFHAARAEKIGAPAQDGEHFS